MAHRRADDADREIGTAEPASKPVMTASIATSSESRSVAAWRKPNLGVDDAVGSDPRRIHKRPVRSPGPCITPTVWANVSRYRVRSLRLAPRSIHAASSSASAVGRRHSRFRRPAR